MASLRSTILHHSLPLLPTHSFTRQTLSLALTTLPPTDPAYRAEPLPDSVLDTIFGPGPVASQALVDAWKHHGLSTMITTNPPSSAPSVPNMLRRRMEYSAEVGEHLVEAYALLSSPSSTPSIPIPSLPIPIKQLLNTRMPPLYTPPNLRALHGTLSTTSSILDGISQRTGGRLPLLRFNPLGPLAYAWGIADEALYQVEKQGEVKKGVMDEPIGAGPEYYASRLSLSLAYLSAEAQLLQPLPPNTPIPNPHLSSAVVALERNLEWHNQAARSMEGVEKGAGEMMGFLEFVGKSWRGLIKSRYW